MSDDMPVRLWLGWRALQSPQADSDWSDFKRNLAETFIPATWQIMKEYKLQIYVPSIFSASENGEYPEEVALLCYHTKNDYDTSKNHILGRSYRIMHRAIFNFNGTDRVSTAKWCAQVGNDGPQLKPTKNGGLRFSDPNASIQVLMLSTPKNFPSSEKIFDALSNHNGNIAIWQKPNFTVIWIASSRVLNESDIGKNFYNLIYQADAKIEAFHNAEIPPPIDQLNGIPIAENKSWHLCRT